jgi:hypothetical protein
MKGLAYGGPCQLIEAGSATAEKAPRPLRRPGHFPYRVVTRSLKPSNTFSEMMWRETRSLGLL